MEAVRSRTDIQIKCMPSNTCRNGIRFTICLDEEGMLTIPHHVFFPQEKAFSPQWSLDR